MKKTAFILTFIALTGFTKGKTPDEKKDLSAGQKGLLEIRALTVKGLKEARRWELLHLKFRQAKRTKIDIQRAKHI